MWWVLAAGLYAIGGVTIGALSASAFWAETSSSIAFKRENRRRGLELGIAAGLLFPLGVFVLSVWHLANFVMENTTT